MKANIKQLLDDLDNIAETDSEIEDTDVREQMADAIENHFFKNLSANNLPNSYGMFTPEADLKVKSAIEKFITNSIKLTKSTEQDRVNQFQDASITSRLGNTYDYYFGHRDADDQPATQPKAWWQFWKP